MIDLIRKINLAETTSFFTDIVNQDMNLNVHIKEPISEEEYNDSDYWYVKYYSKDFDNVIYDRKLFRQHHLNNTLSEKCLNYITSPFEAYYSDLVNKICKTDDMFKEIFRDRRRMFLPKKFDEVIAYKCGLIPFYYSLGEDKVNDEKVGLLISGNTNCDRVLACKLEAYQMLTNGTRDYENSQLREDRELFEYVIGIDLTHDAIKVESDRVMKNGGGYYRKD